MRPVFLFVDLLEDFFREPPLATRRGALVRAVNDLADFAHRQGLPVVWVRQEFRDDLSDAFLSMRDTGRRVTMAGTPGCQVLAELRRRPHDYEIVKKRYSAFFGTDLDRLLDTLGCTHVVIAGVNSHACIRTTAIDAYQRDLRVLLASDGISSYDDGFHRESMRYLEQSIGQSRTNAQLEAMLANASESRADA